MQAEQTITTDHSRGSDEEGEEIKLMAVVVLTLKHTLTLSRTYTHDTRMHTFMRTRAYALMHAHILHAHAHIACTYYKHALGLYTH